MVINCAAIPETLMESEIFGHTKGAFTGASSMKTGKLETANKGIVFLDDVDTLDIGTLSLIDKIGHIDRTRSEVAVAARSDLRERISLRCR